MSRSIRWSAALMPALVVASAQACAGPAPAPAEAPATIYVLASAAPRRPLDTFEDSPAAVLPPRPRSEWTELARKGLLRDALEQGAHRATELGLLPVLFVGQRGCEPCEAVKHHRSDPRMQEALTGTSVMEVDLSRWGGAPLVELGMSPHAIPAFFVLDAHGHYAGKMITGGAWGEDIPENMAPPLSEFFVRARSIAR